MYVWGLQCNHHLVMKTGKLPEGMKHIVTLPGRGNPAQPGAGDAAPRCPLLSSVT